MLFVIAICHPVKWFCVFLSLSFSFIPSYSFSRLVCVCAHTWLRIIWLSNRCTMTALEEGRWFGPVSHACLLYPPALSIPLLSFLSSFFPDLSITNSASCRNGVTGSPCKHSSEIDRQVRKLIVVQDTSAEAQRYSSYTLPASPPLHHPASLWGARPCSFASKLLFLPCSRSWKAGVLAGFHWLLWRSSPNIGLAWKTQEVHHQHHQLLPDWRGLLSTTPAHVISLPSDRFKFYVLCLGNFMFGVWRIHMYHGTKGSFMTPRVYSGPSWKWQTYCRALLS